MPAFIILFGLCDTSLVTIVLGWLATYILYWYGPQLLYA